MATGNQHISGRELERIVRRLAAGAINLSLNDVLGRAVPITPLDEGPLSESGHVVEATPTNLHGEVRFSKPYAARQHEELEYQHLPGRVAKYLETPFKEQVPRYAQFVADTVKKGVELASGGQASTGRAYTRRTT